MLILQFLNELRAKLFTQGNQNTYWYIITLYLSLSDILMLYCIVLNRHQLCVMNEMHFSLDRAKSHCKNYPHFLVIV